MSDLDTFANKFRKWRGDRRYCKYPKYFWDEIRQLASHYPILAIAQALNISPQYIKIRLKKESGQLTFAPLKVVSFPAPVSIEFTDSSSRPMTVRFEASHEQLVNMILSLSGSAS